MNSKQAHLFWGRALAARPPFTPMEPFTPIEDGALRAALTERPDIQIHIQELHGELVMVNLKQVLAFQPLVYTDGLEERIAPTLNDRKCLVELCFPTGFTSEINLTQDLNGLTLISSDPNLSIGPGQWQQNAPNSCIAIFPLQHTLNCLIVASYQGRHFLRDGYHRSTALLRAGVEQVPCIRVEAQSLEQIGWRTGMLSPNLLFGEHPPLLPDFWDDAVSCSAVKQATRRIFRIRVDTLDIPA